MKEIKSVRVRKRNIKTGSLDIKVTLYEKGNDRVLLGINNDNVVWIETVYNKSGLYKDFTDNQFIENFISINSKINNTGNLYDIIQDPWDNKTPKWRNYGFDSYYLNNGAIILIPWNIEDSAVGGLSYSDDSGKEINKNISINKTTSIIGINETSIMQLGESKEIEYKTDNKPSKTYNGLIDDIDIIKDIINAWKKKVNNYDDLELCTPDNESCSIISYKSPIKINPEVENQNVINETKKESILVIIEESIKVKVDTTFKIFIGKNKEINEVIDDITDLSEEYTEELFSGSEESPPDLMDVNTSLDTIQETSSEISYNPGSIIPGRVISLPNNYSHTGEQGFNLLNSQWIGDLITSSLSHIGHPTYDIEGTEQGTLGCASAVSMIFYRAFGVHMKTGKSVKSTPRSIGDFGSKGTGELADWLSNGNLYTKISWQNAQPGDILNTKRATKAGHIGIVINTKNDDGSWNVVSNSSKGFDGGGGGAIKKNYSVKKWQTVADRNPSGTFAYRYIGPKLSPGQVV